MCEARRPVTSANMLLCESDHRFLRSLSEFAAQEKEKLRCPEEGPEEGPDQLRYTVYRTVFSKVAQRGRIRADDVTEADPERFCILLSLSLRNVKMENTKCHHVIKYNYSDYRFGVSW